MLVSGSATASYGKLRLKGIELSQAARMCKAVIKISRWPRRHRMEALVKRPGYGSFACGILVAAMAESPVERTVRL